MRERTAIVIDVPAGEGAARLGFKGRDAWALGALIDAGEQGVTPIERPAPRWSAYVHKLRRAGLVVDTLTEDHRGPFAGWHGRYVLRTPVRVVEERFA